MGYDTHAKLLVAALKLHLIVELQLASLHGAHGLNGEVHDDGLLHPLVNLPLAILQVDRLGTAHNALIHSLDNTAYSLACSILSQQLATLPRLFDNQSLFLKHTFIFLLITTL